MKKKQLFAIISWLLVKGFCLSEINSSPLVNFSQLFAIIFSKTIANRQIINTNRMGVITDIREMIADITEIVADIIEMIVNRTEVIADSEETIANGIKCKQTINVRS